MDLHHIAYLSTSRAPIDTNLIRSILDVARTKNRLNGITGILMSANCSFLQVLEGPKDAVEETFGRINEDTRHHGIIKLLDAPLRTRTFEDWSMAWGELPDEEPIVAEIKHLATLADALDRTDRLDRQIKVLMQSFIYVNNGERRVQR